MVTESAVRIDRRRGWPWFRIQPFSVELDGRIVEKMRGGQSISLPVSSGEHRIRVCFRTLVWSEPVVITLGEDEGCVLECDTDWEGYPWLARKS
jgi:hypothetical protein